MSPDECMRLTSLASCAGCAAKLGPEALGQVLRELKSFPDHNLLVGRDKADDAAVYRVSADVAIVSSVDVFTPIHDDPYTFGQIAAANSLSDVYAMGGRPLVALNVAGWPSNAPLEWLADILRGAADKCAEAEVPIGGGHTVQAAEPLFGLAVTGLVHPDRIVSNAGAKAGDQLILTKPLGAGIITTAMMGDSAPTEVVVEAAQVMSQLNRAASEVMIGDGASAATDVTGFGLVGHVHEMAEASGLTAHVRAAALPLMPGLIALAEEGMLPGGLFRNLEYYRQFADFGALSEPVRHVVCDPQTSGGLLIAVAPGRADALLSNLSSRGVMAALIGEMRAGPAGRVVFA